MAMKHGIAAFAAGLAQSILVAFVAVLVTASAHADWYREASWECFPSGGKSSNPRSITIWRSVTCMDLNKMLT